LRDDEVGRERFEQVSINRVNTFTARDEFADLAINFGGRGGGIHARLDQRRLASHFRRKIALMRDADDLVADAERMENFGG